MSLGNVRLHLVETLEEATAFSSWLAQHPHRIAIDTESTGLSPEKDRLRTVQVGDTETGWCIPVEGSLSWFALVASHLRNYTGTIYMHNAPFDYAFLKRAGLKLPQHQIEDTRLMSHLVEPTASTALKNQAARHVDAQAANPQQELSEAIAAQGWGGVPITFPPYWQYAALDPVLTMRLADVHAPAVPARAFAVENAVIWTLERMSRRGAYVDVPYAQEKYAGLQEYCTKLQAWSKETYGVSLGSNAAIVRILQQEGHEFSKITATGAVALDKEVLGDVDHPLARAVLKHRQYQKLGSTYLEHYITESIDSVIHPSINSVGARTGRMSMSSPNLQNLPRSNAGSAGNVIRNCITARPGNILLMCDFAQIETRIMAHLSRDQGLISAFIDHDKDFFIQLAHTIFGDNTITKSDPRRDIIKTLVYAKIYGAGISKMAKTLNLSEYETKRVDDAFNSSYPGVKEFQRMVTAQPYAICPLSDRVHEAEPGKEYALVNYLIQGMAAFLFKQKLLELDAAGLGDYLILPVHDEVILDIPKEDAEEAVHTLLTVMSDTGTLSVPIQAEVSSGERWGEKREWKRNL